VGQPYLFWFSSVTEWYVNVDVLLVYNVPADGSLSMLWKRFNNDMTMAVYSVYYLVSVWSECCQVYT